MPTRRHKPETSGVPSDEAKDLAKQKARRIRVTRNDVMTDTVSLASLFVPGEGGAPPFLAGRERQLAEISTVTERLTYTDPAVRAPASNIVIYGPRGNGKTVLMSEASERLRQRMATAGPKLQTVFLTPDEIPDERELRRALEPSGGWNEFWRRLKTTNQAGLLTMKLGMKEVREPRLTDVLEARLAGGPLLVMVDEAHELNAGVGRRLLNAAQKARVGKLPFLLMLAGTPVLPERLNRMQATFWDRCLPLRLDLLDRKAAADALVKPLEDRGITFDRDALAQVVEHSNRYPYFLQVWGKALAQALVEDGGEHRPPARVSLGHVERAMPNAEERVRFYCGNRYTELRNAGLLDSAVPIARLYAEKKAEGRPERAYDAELTLAFGGQWPDEKTVGKALNRFKRLGYVWEVGDSFEPGIPSLMAYVLEQYETEKAAEEAVWGDNVPF